MKTHESIYDAALVEWRKASAAFRTVQTAYRSRKIGDAEFLSGKKAFDDATAVFDLAEKAFVKADDDARFEPTETESPVLEGWINDAKP